MIIELDSSDFPANSSCLFLQRVTSQEPKRWANRAGLRNSTQNRLPRTVQRNLHTRPQRSVLVLHAEDTFHVAARVSRNLVCANLGVERDVRRWSPVCPSINVCGTNSYHPGELVRKFVQVCTFSFPPAAVANLDYYNSEPIALHQMTARSLLMRVQWRWPFWIWTKRRDGWVDGWPSMDIYSNFSIVPH